MIECFQIFVGMLCFFGAVLVFGAIALWCGARDYNDKDP